MPIISFAIRIPKPIVYMPQSRTDKSGEVQKKCSISSPHAYRYSISVPISKKARQSTALFSTFSESACVDTCVSLSTHINAILHTHIFKNIPPLVCSARLRGNTEPYRATHYVHIRARCALRLRGASVWFRWIAATARPHLCECEFLCIAGSSLLLSLISCHKRPCLDSRFCHVVRKLGT